MSQTVDKVPLITLVGPPNSGKTTLFNYLSGKNYKTVNYPGATVEYSICRLQGKFNLEANLLDSPGIVSLLPHSPDEKVSIDSLFSHPELGTPDLVIATVDASQFSRHVFLVNQLIQSGFNIILAVTMSDLLKRKGYEVDVEKLSKNLGCSVVEVDGRTGRGADELVRCMDLLLENSTSAVKPSNNFTELNKFELLAAYKEIEELEKEVIVETCETNFDINKANSSLKILNSELKKPLNSVDAQTLKIDRILLHPVWGLISFFVIMSMTFTSIFWLADPLMGYIDEFFGYLSEAAVTTLGYNWFGDLIANGIIAGAGSVLVFVPQIIILFLILGLLEDTGYLARGAMLIDKPLSKIGLNGKSFVPMLSGFACAIPAMLATRTIPNKRERFLTIFIIPLMSCSARLPVYALLIAFLIPAERSWLAGLALAAIYMFSILSSVVIAGIANKFRHKIIKEEDNSSFILELPSYRAPKLKVVLYNTIDSSKAYLRKAGPVILFLSLTIWCLTYFPNVNPQVETEGLNQEEIHQAQEFERLSTSYASDLGKFIQPVMTPLGMDWRVGVSLIAAFAAREVFVSSLALIFKVTSDEESLQSSMIMTMREAEIEGTGEKLFTESTIIGLIVFFIFALQCISTIAVSRKETGGWRIPMLQLVIFTTIAYSLTFITVNGLRLIGFN